MIQKYNISIDFNAKLGSNLDQAFAMMKNYQAAGLADKDSRIKLNGVYIAAGYLENVEQATMLYEAIVTGNQENLQAAIPTGLTSDQVESILMNTESEMTRLGKGSIPMEKHYDIVAAKSKPYVPTKIR